MRACRSSRPGYEGHSLSFCAIRRRSCSGPSTHTRTRTCPASASSTARRQRPRQRGAPATRSRSPSSHARPIIGALKMQEIEKRSRRRALLEGDCCDCWRVTSRHMIVTCWCRVSAKTRRRCGAVYLQGHVLLWSPLCPSAATTCPH